MTTARRAALLGAVSAVTVAGQEKAEAFGKNPSDWLGYYKDLGEWMGNGWGMDSCGS